MLSLSFILSKWLYSQLNSPPKKTNQTKQNSLSYVLWLEKPRLQKDFYIFLPLQIAGVFQLFSLSYLVIKNYQATNFPLAQNARPRMLRGSHILHFNFYFRAQKLWLVSDVITLKYIGAVHTLLLISSGFVTVCLNALIYYSLQSLGFFFKNFVLLCFVCEINTYLFFKISFGILKKRIQQWRICNSIWREQVNL